jgi:hypothetical protein
MRGRAIKETRRFCNPKVTQFGRIGHPAPLDRKMVRCAGVTFEDRQEGTKWTLRKYDPYPPDWPAMDVWTMQQLIPVEQQSKRGVGYSNQRPVPEEFVPDDVKEFGIAQLVRMRLNGQVRG